MKVKTSVGGWKDGQPKIKVDGAWKGLAKEFVKTEGIWKDVTTPSGEKSLYKGVVVVGSGSFYGITFIGYNNSYGIGSRNPTSVNGYNIVVINTNGTTTPLYRVLTFATAGNNLAFMNKFKRVVVNGVGGVVNPEARPNYIDGFGTTMSFILDGALSLSGQWNIEIFGD